VSIIILKHNVFVNTDSKVTYNKPVLLLKKNAVKIGFPCFVSVYSIVVLQHQNRVSAHKMMVNSSLHRASPRTPGGGKHSLPPPGVRGLKSYVKYWIAI
jgi:hypothetical protein